MWIWTLTCSEMKIPSTFCLSSFRLKICEHKNCFLGAYEWSLAWTLLQPSPPSTTMSDMSQSLVLNEQESATWRVLHLHFWSLFLAWFPKRKERFMQSCSVWLLGCVGPCPCFLPPSLSPCRPVSPKSERTSKIFAFNKLYANIWPGVGERPNYSS